MLTTRRLQELGFKIKGKGYNWYMQKGNFCLFPMNGSWAIGSDFGTLATGADGIILCIDTEEQLEKSM
ncbi:hypothetical protein ACLI1A_11065 [Flavobacterium sp. RHBU_3]|uniref:hypothetical protein n=1 Tax=Flavobacterium sp. RHBU_3 TaxID=3391184 RepID=UPI0039854A3D